MSKDTVTLLINLLRKKLPDLQAIYLFGSRADNTHFTEESDWDIALLSEGYKGYDHKTLWEVQMELSAELNLELDLVDLRNVVTLFQFEIIRTSKIIWTKNRSDAAVYEARILNEYQDFRSSQEEIIQDILDRGRVYGK
ncbi:MAG: nucleotidyltransferase domain-containing protein [Bacteroidota bacterium]